MSALDDVIESQEKAATYAEIGNAPEIAKVILANTTKAREELELLRDMAFSYIEMNVHHHGRPTSDDVSHNERRILRSDPERAKKLGLEWALL